MIHRREGGFQETSVPALVGPVISVGLRDPPVGNVEPEGPLGAVIPVSGKTGFNYRSEIEFIPVFRQIHPGSQVNREFEGIKPEIIGCLGGKRDHQQGVHVRAEVETPGKFQSESEIVVQIGIPVQRPDTSDREICLTEIPVIIAKEHGPEESGIDREHLISQGVHVRPAGLLHGKIRFLLIFFLSKNRYGWDNEENDDK